MSTTKEKRATQLGMNPSTAQHALKKQLMFSLAKKCSMDICFQCGLEIETHEELSVEHKTPWLDSSNPKELFFDLDNIAFSHLECNVRAARRDVKPCGTSAAYQKGCRCDSCRKANSTKASREYEPSYRRARYLKNEKTQFK